VEAPEPGTAGLAIMIGMPTEYEEEINITPGEELQSTVAMTNCTISDNNFGIYVDDDGNLTANFNKIVGNDIFGVYKNNTPSVDAKNNWWGDTTGPYYSTNPNGQGDTVSDNVDFDPWCSDSGCTGGGGGAGGAASIGFTSSFAEWTVTTVKDALDWLFDRAEQDTDGVSIYLHKGWNTFKLPWFVLTGTAQNKNVSDALAGNYSVTNVLSSLGINYNYIAYYDGTTWRVYSTAGDEVITDDFTEFPHDPSDADYNFYIYMTTGDRLTIGTED